MLNIAASFTRTDVRVIAAGSFVVGGVTGYFVARKTISDKLKKHYDDKFREEAAWYKDVFDRKHKTGAYSTPESASEELTTEGPSGIDFQPSTEKIAYNRASTLDLSDRVVELGYREGVVSHGDERVTVTVSVDPLEERHESVMGRDPEKPYVVSIDEFTDGEVGFDTVTITYWEGDGVLVGEDDRIMDIASTVGHESLENFGNGSNDENIVYVRNEKIAMDFEIVRDPGLYSVSVAGFHPEELETSQKMRRPSRPRSDD